MHCDCIMLGYSTARIDIAFPLEISVPIGITRYNN